MIKSKPSNKYQFSKKLISDHSSCCDALQTPSRMRVISGAHRSAALSVRATCESGIQYLKEMMSEVPIRRTRRGGKVNTTRRKSQRTFSPLIICCDIPCTKLWALTRSCWQHMSYHFTPHVSARASVIAVIWSDRRSGIEAWVVWQRVRVGCLCRRKENLTVAFFYLLFLCLNFLNVENQVRQNLIKARQGLPEPHLRSRHFHLAVLHIQFLERRYNAILL